jgi:hypothetical protein
VKTEKITTLGGLLVLLGALIACATGTTGATRPAPSSPKLVGVGRNDDRFLEDLSHRAFTYFIDQADRETGLVRDRARARADAEPLSDSRRDVASIAATGFGLTALCIGAARGWIPEADARTRVEAALGFLVSRAPQEHGWLYHWMDARSGERVRNSEASSIDTALLLAGVLTARQAFNNDPAIVRAATELYDRIDFQWMLNDDPALLSHGWRPETGFLRPRWNRYSEHAILDLLGIGSSTHPLRAETWRAWQRDWIEYAGYRYITGATPLFVHQYSQAWIDFRPWRESWPPNVNYFENSVAATRAHRQFCLDELARQFPESYAGQLWGVSASDSAHGYVAWGGPPAHRQIDGTVVPNAAAGSLMFTPDISLQALREMRERFGAAAYDRYGFADAFNPTTGWVDSDVIGIDVGITLLSAENLRSGRVWRWFMANPEITTALKRAGFEEDHH